MGDYETPIHRDVKSDRRGPMRKLIEALQWENARLRAENFSLAAWQCEFTDGKTGLVAGEGGSTYCAMAKRVEHLRAALEPFADVIKGHWSQQPDDLPLDVGFGATDLRLKLRLGDFRTARTALEEGRT